MDEVWDMVHSNQGFEAGMVDAATKLAHAADLLEGPKNILVSTKSRP